MKFDDLHDVEIGDILTCKDLGAIFKVTDIDMGANMTPIRVDLIDGPDDLTSGTYGDDDFDKDARQWLYADVKKLRFLTPNIEELIDMDKLITLERLEPVKTEFAVPTESEEFEAIAASQAAELSKRKILRELMDRIREAISSDLGVFELKVPDLDLDSVTSDLEWLGYIVRFSMQDDEFTISWEP